MDNKIESTDKTSDEAVSEQIKSKMSSEQAEDKRAAGSDIPDGDKAADTLKARSRVNPDKRLSPQQLLVCVMAGLIIILFMLSSCGQRKASKPAAPLKAPASEAELSANMTALNRGKKPSTPVMQDTTSLDAHHPVSPGASQNSSDGNSAPTDAELMIAQAREQARQEAERALQVRLNAPSSMMTGRAKSANTEGSPSGNSPSTAVLAGRGSNSDFANQQTSVDTVSAHDIAHPGSTVAQGELIQATLETPIDSDLPGMVRAVTTVPIYAYTGNTPLIPAGSRLIGQYSAGVIQGQSRVMVVWNRIILPGGISAQLNSPGTDDQGMAGQGADSINRHFWGQFGQATLLSIIGAGAANAGVSGSDEYNSASAYRSALSGSFSDTASSVLDQSIDTKPTLKIFQGAQINVFVARDVDFYSVFNQG